ncbi:Protein-arginine deiminase [Cordyceps fumosorosea ARSEF 2679]|uniref:Protein-arginine deiminase n=1 Tax=Cordyceps fumosorosea (strain ARSEF 2679) TaxID=1081104 RepID=A0A167S8Q7_CORFA|nr:Protein-arginine deiminase [Cordyceps fumosorosea ARSEF 2679]OAA59372.1 Protein-arginine deiminase [Cordyceps fumosorosea ARSEF 2679]
MRSIPVIVTGLAALAAGKPTDKRATAPTKEQLCVGFNDDFDACQRETTTCIREVQGEFSWDKVSQCLEGKRPPPTKEQLCVGFNDDFDACQRATVACGGEIQGGFTWAKISKCLEGKSQGTASETGTKTNNDFKADLRVDTNRDGVVDMEGSSDVEGKTEWTETSGAIFLANIGDSGDRCKKLHANLKLNNLEDIFGKLAKCHDADDDTQRAPRNMAPMRTVPIQGLSDSATGSVSVSDTQARSLVRIFRAVKDGNGWEIVNDDTVFSAQDLKQGLTLGIDARDTRRAGGWDGRVTVDFTVRDGAASSTDSVMLRVAPVLLHHHRQPIKQVFASSFRGGSMAASITDYVQGLIRGIENSMQRAGVPGPIKQLETDDPWAQDYLEPGYTSMPGPDGSVVWLRVVIEGRHRPERNSTGLIYTTLRGDGVGAVAAYTRADLQKRDAKYDAGGNMEMLPPYEHNGAKFPAGRIIVGGDARVQPKQLDFLQAQEVQAPLVLDSTWLFVEHIDEMVQAIPAKTERGWALLAIDPQVGLSWLRMAEERGLGDQPVVNGKLAGRSGPTISQFLREPENIRAAEFSGQRMAANLDILKKETGITDAEIFRVPSLITTKTVGKKYLGQKRRRDVDARDEATEEEEAALDAEFLEFVDSLEEEGGDLRNGTQIPRRRRRQVDTSESPEFDSLLPSLVNGVPLSDSHYVAPKPFGPVINGRDMFELVATSVYNKAGFTTVDFVDDWRLHLASGDVHCFTNTYRDASQPWWSE